MQLQILVFCTTSAIPSFVVIFYNFENFIDLKMKIAQKRDTIQ
jgi:hypothetical protein